MTRAHHRPKEILTKVIFINRKNLSHEVRNLFFYSFLLLHHSNALRVEYIEMITDGSDKKKLLPYIVVFRAPKKRKTSGNQTRGQGWKVIIIS
jgi:replication initiation and membrane attachment protein DnaB